MSCPGASGDQGTLQCVPCAVPGRTRDRMGRPQKDAETPRSHQSRIWGHHGADGWKHKERLGQLDEEEKGGPNNSSTCPKKGALDILEIDSAASALALLETGGRLENPTHVPPCRAKLQIMEAEKG